MSYAASVHWPPNEINEIQTVVMTYIQTRIKEEKVPVPQKEIILAMTKNGTPIRTTVSTLYVLLKKGYIRRAYTGTNKTFYVQLRNL